MSNTLRPVLRRKAMAVLAAMVLLGSGSAAVPLHRAADADVLYYSEQFYSDATYSVKVGAANGFCDGDYIWHWGYPTAYSKIVYRYNCP
jgi:hypothetical protein